MDIIVSNNIFWFAVLLTLWSIPWKGYALWKAARFGHRWWFVILLVVNTAAVIDIFYIVFVARRFKTGVPKTIEAEK